MTGAWGLAAGSARRVTAVLAMLAFAAAVGPAQAGSNGVSGLNASLVDGCVDATLSALIASYRTDRAVQVEDVQSILLSTYLPCMNYANERKELVVVWPSDDDNLDTYETYANLYMARVPVVIKVVPVPMAEMAERVLAELNDNSTEHNLTVFASSSLHLGDMAEGGAVYSLLSFLKTDSTYNWGGVLKLFKDQMASYGMAPVGMPLTGPLLHFYYRKDLFASYDFPMPETWDQLVQLVHQARQSAEAGGDWEHALCSDYISGCRAHEGFFAILASYVQTVGSDQGYIISAQTLSSFLETEAGVAALGVMMGLRGSHSMTQNCTELDRLFTQGKCLMAISDGTLFKRAHLAGMLGQVGITPLPGTSTVMMASTGAMVACNSSTCPFGFNSTTGGLVNRVPYSPVRNNSMMHVFSGATGGSQAAGYSWFASISGPETSTYFVTSPQIELEPFRDVHLQELSWAPFNYDSSALQQYLSSVQTSGSSPNGAVSPRFPLTVNVLDLVNASVSKCLQGTLTAREAASAMGADLRNLLYSGPNLTTAAMYRRSLNWVNHTLPGGPADGNGRHSHGGLEARILVPAVVVPTLVLMFLVAVTLGFMFYAKRDPRRSLLGRAIPPPISANSTVIVAELQDITALWEHLPHETMQAAVQMHSKLMTQLLHKHCGYLSVREECTDVLVFHNCKDALLFCMELQDSLLHLNWSVELLQHDQCRPVWMTYRDNAAEAAPFMDSNNKKEEEEDEVATAEKIPAAVAAVEEPVNAEHVAISFANNMLAAPGNDAAGSAATSYMFRTACKLMWQLAQETDADAVLVSRGFRVRCGMHTGMDENDQVAAGVDGRSHYKGQAVSLARALCAVAHWGMSIVSEASYRQLPMEDLWEKVMVLHGGEHELTDIVGCVNLYAVVNRHLRGRIASLPPLLSERQISLGVTEAPLGRITIVFMNIVGMQTLQGWNADIAQQAVQMFHHTAGSLLQRFNGYQVEATDSLLLASFYYPAEAILFCLETQRRLLKLYWPKELLAHELGEEVVVSMPGEGGRMVDRVVLRGLRIKAGIDQSDAKGSVHAITGRITYRGKMMNRAARIGVTATTGQILCSEGVLTQANHRDALRMKQIDTVSLGLFSLKGVAEKMQVYQIRYDLTRDANARRFSDPLNIHSEVELEPHLLSSRRSSKYRANVSSRSLNCASLTSIPATSLAPDSPGSAGLMRRSHSRRYSYISQNHEGAEGAESAVDLGRSSGTHSSRAHLPGPGNSMAGMGELPTRDRRASRRAIERLSQLMSPADLDLFLAKLSEASAQPSGGRPGEPK